MLRNERSRALVESVALEIDRLIETASDESEKLPEALRQPLADHLQTLSGLLAENFDPKRGRRPSGAPAERRMFARQSGPGQDCCRPSPNSEVGTEAGTP